MGLEESWTRMEGVLEEDCSIIYVDFRRFSSMFIDFVHGVFKLVGDCEKMRFTCFSFYFSIPAFQALSCLANDRS